LDVQFVASVAPIVRDADAARRFYRDGLGLSFEGEAGDYVFTHKLQHPIRNSLAIPMT
jgi:catechol 2,3-dioxygenase-like lactoylglutathione lyase family enzyme